MKALLLIDVQLDFMPNGSLAVPHGDDIVPVINQLIPQFDLVVATQDWHPQDHISFAENHPNQKAFDEIRLGNLSQTLWPTHCVQNSAGADFHPDLHTQAIEAIFRKGTDPTIDSYSAFYDNAHQKSTGLSGYLNEKGVKELYIAGLAGDICVYFSVKDAIDEGFTCIMIEDAIKSLNEADANLQKKELQEKGVSYTSASQLLA